MTPPLLLNSLHRNTATHFPASARFVNACRALRPATRLPPLLPPLGQGALARRGAVHSCDRQWLRDRGTRTEERREWRVFRRPGINSRRRRHDISGLCASKRGRNTDAFERYIERPRRTGSQPQIPGDDFAGRESAARTPSWQFDLLAPAELVHLAHISALCPFLTSPTTLARFLVALSSLEVCRHQRSARQRRHCGKKSDIEGNCAESESLFVLLAYVRRTHGGRK